MENRKNNIWIMVLLILIIVGLVGYICYDKLFAQKGNDGLVQEKNDNIDPYSIKNANINYEDDLFISYELDEHVNQYVNKKYIIYDKTSKTYLNDKYNTDDYTIVYFGKIYNTYYYCVFYFVNDVDFNIDIYDYDGTLVKSLPNMTYDNDAIVFTKSPNTVSEGEYVWKPFK